ncbi:hypothetical protein ABEV00_21950 [Paenibacillus thiaminolyticus]|uniref:hypothetical protein n=1 Tax=Paenibacillus thiaminolyticus TaxID=49283 RepID=UPI003D2D6EF0
MKIEVYEEFDGSKLVAFLVDDDGTERELLRSEVGNDDLLNKIEDMNLSPLTVTFHWASEKCKICNGSRSYELEQGGIFTPVACTYCDDKGYWLGVGEQHD